MHLKWPKAVHPPLFAASIPINLFAANAGIVSISEAFLPTVIVVFASLLVWLLAQVVLRDVERSASVASVFGIGFFFHTEVLDAGSRYFSRSQSTFDLAARYWIWLAIWVAIVLAAGWKARYNRNINLFLNVSALACFLLAIGTVSTTMWRQAQIHAQFKEVSNPLGASGVQPGADIYYLILDGYGRQDVLRSIYGLDNSNFVDSLELLGFFVAKEANSNFCQTEISLASSLNMCGPEGFPKPKSSAGWDRMALDEMIDQSRLAGLLRKRSYSYLAVTSGFPPFHFQSADHMLSGNGKYSLFVDALMAKTPIRLNPDATQSQFETRRSDLKAAFHILRDLAAPSGSPKFCIAHIFAPHPPFVFKANGEPQKPTMAFGIWDGSHFMARGGTVGEYRSGYRDQIQYVNALLRETIEKIVKTNPNAIIILQGDHGPKSELDQDSLEKTNVNEVFPILLAIRAPKDLQAQFYPSMTPVNAIRLIVNFVTGSTIPKSPDRSYYSTWEKPLEFTDVTDKLSEPEPAAADR